MEPYKDVGTTTPEELMAVGQSVSPTPPKRSWQRSAILVGILLFIGGLTWAAIAFSGHTTKPATSPSPQAGLSTTDAAKLGDNAATGTTILQVTQVIAEQGNYATLIAKALQVTADTTIGGNLKVVGNGTFGGSISASNLSGNGAGLTAVNAQLLDGQPGSYYTDATKLQGSISDGQLSANVALRSAPNTFSASNNFTGGLSANTVSTGSLTVTGSTSLSGTTTISSLILSTPLSVASGGTGLTTIPAGGVVYGQGAGSLGTAVPSAAGQCLVSTATAVQFGSCSGAVGSGVTTLDTLAGDLILANSTAAGATVTIDNASTSAKGIAQFNATNFSVASGVVNTAQNITVTSSPTFAGLTLTTALAVASGGTGDSTLPDNGVVIGQGTGALTAVTSVSAGQCLVSTSGTPTFAACPGTGGVTTLNGASGALAVADATYASQTITINNASTTARGLASFNSGNFTVTSGSVNTIQNIAVGATPTFAGLSLTSALSIANGGTGSTTALGARGTLGAAASGSNGDITALTGLTTAISSAQGGTGVVTTPTSGQILIGNGLGYSLNTLTAGTGINITNAAGGITITATSGGTCASCANTSLSNLSAVAINTSLLPATAGAANLGSTVVPFGQLAIAGSSASPAVNNFLITGASTSGTRTITLPDASGTVAVSATGPINIDALGNISCATCLTSGGGPPGGVSSLNTATGALTLQGVSAGSISVLGSNIIIADATAAVKGLASFNNANFSVTNGAVNTIQNISNSASPSFAGLSLSTALSIANGGTGAISAAGALANLGGAANGANSDITTISGLTTALSVGQGGTGTSTLATGGVILGNGTGALSAITGSNGQCLVISGTTPAFATCPSGSAGSYVSLQSGTPGTADTGNLNVSGTAIAGSFQGLSLDTVAAGTLGIGNTKATTINLGTNNSAHTINLGTGATTPQTVTIGSTYGASSTTIQGGDNGITFNQGNSTAGGFDFNVHGNNVIGIDYYGRTFIKPVTNNIGAIFQVDNSSGTSLLSVTSNDDTTYIQGGGLSINSSGINNDGTLRFTGNAYNSYVTPLGTSISSKIIIANNDPGNFGQIIALGLPSSANSTARAITLFDARTGAHQPTISIVSPNENQVFGLSYDGSNTTGYIKNSSNNIVLQANSRTIFTGSYISNSATLLQLGSGTVTQGNLSFANATNNFELKLTAGATSSDTTIVLPTGIGAAGQCLAVASASSGTEALGYASCSAGSGSFVTLQGSTPGAADTGNTNISGTAIANAFVGTSLDTATNTNLSVGTANANGVTIGSSTINTTVAASTFNINAATVGTNTSSLSLFNTTPTLVSGLNAATSITLGATSGNFAVQNPTFTVGAAGPVAFVGAGNAGAFFTTAGYTAVSASSGNTALRSGAVSGATSNSGTVSVQSGSSSTSGNTGAITIASGNAAGGNSGNITIDSGAASATKGTISIGQTNASGLTLGRTGLQVSLPGSLLIGAASNSAGSISFANASNSNTATIQGDVTTTSYTTTLPTAIGAAGQCLSVASVAGAVQSLGYASCSAGSGNFISLQSASPGVADNGNLNLSGTGLFSTAVASASIRPIADSTSAITFTNAAGTITIAAIDSTNSQLIVGTSGNTITLSPTTGLVAAGTARHTKTISLNAEYPASVLDASNDSACSAANNGTMTSGYYNAGATNINYYQWVTAQSTAQCYDVVAQITVPNDFSAWASTTPITVQSNTTSTSLGTVKAMVIDTAGTTETGYNYASVTPGTASTWTTVTGASALIGTYTPGSTMIVRLRITATSAATVQLGSLNLSYLSKF